MAEIVRRSDIAYGTFFNHYPSKLHLLREVADHSMRDLFENVEGAASIGITGYHFGTSEGMLAAIEEFAASRR